MFLTAVGVYLIEKDFLRAFAWTIPLVVFSFFGLIHSSEIGFGMAGMVPLGYMFFALVMILLYFFNKHNKMEMVNK
ncbi:MAG TPA: hypothetical protein P5346_16480, partial [Spirochaetota bacterium]|nr:hypothetical protein [Spirochaetota bacterium]